MSGSLNCDGSRNYFLFSFSKLTSYSLKASRVPGNGLLLFRQIPWRLKVSKGRSDASPRAILTRGKRKWKSLGQVQLFVTPWTIQSMEFSRPEYWEWVAFPFSRGFSQSRNQTGVSCIAGGFFTSWVTREAQDGVGGLSLLQQIFLTQEMNWGLLHCRCILYQLAIRQELNTAQTNSENLSPADLQ